MLVDRQVERVLADAEVYPVPEPDVGEADPGRLEIAAARISGELEAGPSEAGRIGDGIGNPVAQRPGGPDVEAGEAEGPCLRGDGPCIGRHQRLPQPLVAGGGAEGQRGVRRVLLHRSISVALEALAAVAEVLAEIV